MPRPPDHLVLAAHDLAAMAAFYTKLGFQVGPRNRHPWGTHNHIVQLDGAFLELIGLGEGFSPPGREAPAAAFAGFVAAHLGRREGFAMLALRTDDAAADLASFQAAGIDAGPLLAFQRKAATPGGGEAEVGFKLAFAGSSLLPDAGFFTCQHLSPENFWAPALQIHPNGARRLAGMVMVAENPADHAEFLGHFTGQRVMNATSMGLEIDVGGVRIEVLTPAAWRFRSGLAEDWGERPPAWAGFRIAVEDVRAAAAIWRRAGIGFAEHNGAAIVPPWVAFGAALLLEPA